MSIVSGLPDLPRGRRTAEESGAGDTQAVEQPHGDRAVPPQGVRLAERLALPIETRVFGPEGAGVRLQAILQAPIARVDGRGGRDVSRAPRCEPIPMLLVEIDEARRRGRQEIERGFDERVFPLEEPTELLERVRSSRSSPGRAPLCRRRRPGTSGTGCCSRRRRSSPCAAGRCRNPASGPRAGSTARRSHRR